MFHNKEDFMNDCILGNSGASALRRWLRMLCLLAALMLSALWIIASPIGAGESTVEIPIPATAATSEIKRKSAS